MEIAKLLLDAGADITGPGRLLSEILTASMKPNHGVVELLIECGAKNAEFEETSVEVLRRLILIDESEIVPDPEYVTKLDNCLASIGPHNIH